jgi:hypothetical protein
MAYLYLSRGSSVGIVTRLPGKQTRSRISISGSRKILLYFQNIHTISGALPASYSAGSCFLSHGQRGQNLKLGTSLRLLPKLGITGYGIQSLRLMISSNI